jgi:hypothetical protein
VRGGKKSSEIIIAQNTHRFCSLVVFRCRFSFLLLRRCSSLLRAVALLVVITGVVIPILARPVV